MSPSINRGQKGPSSGRSRNRSKEHFWKRKPAQTELKLNTWGGKREGAGRKGSGHKYIPHTSRPEHKAAHPVHVTLRALFGVPSLREQAFPVVRDALKASSKSFFRVVHFSVQSNHIHLIVEASDR